MVGSGLMPARTTLVSNFNVLLRSSGGNQAPNGLPDYAVWDQIHLTHSKVIFAFLGEGRVAQWVSVLGVSLITHPHQCTRNCASTRR